MPRSSEFSFANPGFEKDEADKRQGQEPKTETLALIEEDENSISYLGVKLEKSHTPSPFIPEREKHADYNNDRFALELQQKIAVNFLSGDPALIEGGTSIGKTTTVRKMCSELGWEVHYANLNGATDVEDLMGRYIPNPHRTQPDDPEFVFADGRVTAGLRQEEEKTKVIILDEYNAAAPNIVIRLHEVLDALERDGEVVLSEDASETVPVSKSNTKIIALTNPPGKGYFGREPLDPAQLRRWVYLKEVSNLPESTFSFSTKSLFGLTPKTEIVPEEAFLKSQDGLLSPEQVGEIPGLGEVEAKYEEFHKAAKKLLGQRKIGADQPQQFKFDDRMEPRRVRDFVMRFYKGDINETFQKALRYYYSNKLESAEDRQKLEELISHVGYVPQPDSRRLGLEDEARAERTSLTGRFERELSDIMADPSIPDSVKEALASGEKLSADISERIREAKEIMNKDFIGPSEIKTAFGFEPELATIPEIPFERSELERAKELGQMLVLRVGKNGDGEPMTMKNMGNLLSDKVKDGGKVFYNTDWYKDEAFFKDEQLKDEWVLVSREVIPDSTSKSYLEQTEALVDYLKNKVFESAGLPKEYQDAISEFESQKAEIAGLIDSDWQKAAERLGNLSIAQMTRQTPAEAIYDLITAYQNTDERLLPNIYTWTSGRASDGKLVGVGHFESDGVDVNRHLPGYRYGYLGVSFSRSL
ncbi:hypothetical protein COY62_00405 [bacterium (Candidatus Howlettbacteria) CG_4_10_14_0_8_um_filter_40_9]|nr:MAG: hypothetical protein COY62_00405 [bacterium (Candidatus Howlettbacteria) CG_4_10_14_0_8_um_filter_40_9]